MKPIQQKLPLHGESFCRECQRPLTDPKSIAVGLGPECLKIKSRISRLIDRYVSDQIDN